jgi:diaminopimelate epimerase
MLEFIKMHGCGNDFMVIDCRKQKVDLDKLPISQLSDYKKSVGFDQLLLIYPSAQADVAVKIFNRDGSEAEACGNGARCIAKLILSELSKPVITMEIKSRIITANWQEDWVAVNMGEAKIIEENIDFGDVRGALVNVSNPHVIILNESNVLKYGPIIEHDLRFPNKVNVNFIKLIDANTADLNVWERGVGTTLACGSGACASAYFLFQSGLLSRTSLIRQAGGDLSITINEADELIMAGEAVTIYYGKLL